MSYTKEKKGERFVNEWLKYFEELKDDSSLILFAIEWSLYMYLLDSPGSLDIEILTGLEYVRRRLSPITFPGEIRNTFGEILLDLLKTVEQESKVNKSRIPDILDKAIKFVKQYKGESMRSNEFVKGFMGYMEKYHPETVERILKKKKSPIIEIE